jgi:hypothetical protein
VHPLLQLDCDGDAADRKDDGASDERHAMNNILLKAVLALIPASMLLSGAVVLFRQRRSASLLLQVVGAGCLLIVILTHVAEAVHLFPWMGWGLESSVGHYLDLSSAVLGLALFPLGYLMHAIATRRT